MICTIAQRFGENANPLYTGYGLKGHPGEDVACGYGTDIECPLDIYVYKIIDDKRPSNDGTGYWAIFGIGQYKGQWGELCIGHPSRIDINLKDKVSKGRILGAEGNHGEVYAGSIQITKAMQDAGNHMGAHRHWQWRPLNKVQHSSGNVARLTAYPLSVYTDPEGNQYEIPDFRNGYNGCSPVIADILKDYDDWKLAQALPPTPLNDDIMKQRTLFIKILEKFLILQKSFKSYFKS